MQFWKRLFPNKQKSKPSDGHPYDLDALPTGARLHYQKGFELLNTQRLDLAEAEFVLANEIAPWHKMPLFMLVYSLIHQDKIAQANEIIQELLEDSPLDHFAIFLQAHLKYYKHQYDEALKLYNKALYRRFNFLQPYLDRAGILVFIKKDFDKARHDIEYAKRLDPNHIALYELEATIAFHENDLVHTESLITDGLKIDPNNEILLVIRGNYLSEKKEYILAKDDYVKVLTSNPLSLDAQYGLAVVHYHTKEYEKAVELFTKITELEPKHYLAWSLRGRSLILLEQYDEAIESCTKAIEIHPNVAMAYINRRHAFNRSKQYQKALEDETIILELEKPTGLLLRSYTLGTLGKYDEAIDYLDSLIEISPDKDIAYNDRAWKKCHVGKYKEAKDDVEKAISLDDTKSNYFGTYGQVKWLIQDFQGALRMYTKALEIEDSDVFNLEKSVALLKLDKQNKAIAIWREVTADDAEFQSAEAYQEEYRFAPPFYEAMQELEKLAQENS